MTTAFQSNAFQNNAFQIDPPPVVQGGGDSTRRKKKKQRVVRRSDYYTDEEFQQALAVAMAERGIGLSPPQTQVLEASVAPVPEQEDDDEDLIIKAAILRLYH